MIELFYDVLAVGVVVGFVVYGTITVLIVRAEMQRDRDG